jgi:UDP-N-acetylmuramate dehydrogenase
VVDVSALDTETSQLVTLDRSACEFAYRDSLFKSESPPRHIILSLRLQLSSGWAPRLDYPALQQALTEAGIVNPDPQQLFDTVCQIRRSKLPDPALLGNAGSFFKNPLISIEKLEQLRQRFADLPYYPSESAGLVKIPAAWLLDQLGWKGRSRGNAAVHSEHALVLVNPGQATGEDILLLAQAMSSAVLSEFGIALQPEVRIL